MNNKIEDRVRKLRAFMQSEHLDAFIVVSSDPHSSEYVADCWKSREWISGFDGSAGAFDGCFRGAAGERPISQQKNVA